MRTAASHQVQITEAGQQVFFTRDGFTARLPASATREAWGRGVLLADNLPL